MKVLKVRNVHDALPEAIRLITTEGIARDSRNGPVLQYPTPVTTVYERPLERVIFHPERDANPFFHLYESLWMLAGRNDVAGPRRYVEHMKTFSDDGEVFHGAYGHRWRQHFQNPPRYEDDDNPIDQLKIIATRLKALPDDRRSILQMWDANVDLTTVDTGKDHPCNTIATFQISTGGNLDLCLFCRSNDTIWGAYGANAVHFSFLLEYVAHWVGVPVGRFYQVSVNWHAYTNVLEKVLHVQSHKSPYEIGACRALPLALPEWEIAELDAMIAALLWEADHGFDGSSEMSFDNSPFFNMAYWVLRAHYEYKMDGGGPLLALDHCLTKIDRRIDWVKTACEWLHRRVK